MFVQLLLASSATLHVALYDDYDVGGPHPASTSSVDALEFGTRAAPLVVAIQGKSASLDVIAEWEPACHLLAAAGFHVVLPNLHSNEHTKPGKVASTDVQQIMHGICLRYDAATVVIMGKMRCK